MYLESHFGQIEARRAFAENSSSPVGEADSEAAPDALSPASPHDGQAIAKLTIPRLGTELYVVEGDDDRDLDVGPGHMPGTAMPGAGGNCVIAGHRDTHFRVLKDLKKDDEIVLETGSGRYVYRVDSMSIVRPTNTDALQPTPDAELHLITCYPFRYVGAAPKRFVVQAELERTAPGPS